MIEFVFLDAGGTLIDPYPSVGDIYARAGRPHGLEARPADLQEAFARVWQDARAREGQHMMTFGLDVPETHGFWRGLVFEVLDHVGFAGDREACFRAFFAAFEQPGAWRVYDDVEPLLDELERRKLPVGVLSNWDFRLPALLEAVGLRARLDPLIVSCFEGIAKPDPELYRRAAARVGVSPERILYVGDHRHLDLDPAKEAGMRAFLIDRRSLGEDPEVVAALTDLLEHLPEQLPG